MLLRSRLGLPDICPSSFTIQTGSFPWKWKGIHPNRTMQSDNLRAGECDAQNLLCKPCRLINSILCLKQLVKPQSTNKHTVTPGTLSSKTSQNHSICAARRHSTHYHILPTPDNPSSWIAALPKKKIQLCCHHLLLASNRKLSFLNSVAAKPALLCPPLGWSEYVSGTLERETS